MLSGEPITGTLTIPDQQARTVDLNMPSGNQTIIPDNGKVLSKVTVTKPTTMIPENIKKDVNIGGVIGTLESGGTGGGGAPNYMQLSFANVRDITIEHNLNRIPIGIIIARGGWGTTSDVGFYCCALADGKRINGGHSGGNPGNHIYNSLSEINTLYGSNSTYEMAIKSATETSIVASAKTMRFNGTYNIILW